MKSNALLEQVIPRLGKNEGPVESSQGSLTLERPVLKWASFCCSHLILASFSSEFPATVLLLQCQRAPLHSLVSCQNVKKRVLMKAYSVLCDHTL